MKIAEVAKLTPHEQFLYWITQRHEIYLKKLKGLPAPWTDDEVLQTYFFTHPYRENDKVTVWFRDKIRDPLSSSPHNPDDVLMATVIFRWFNLPATGKILIENKLLTAWDQDLAIKKIREASQGGKVPVFTGAYMIKAGNGEPGIKIPSVCAAISNVWKQRQRLISTCKEQNTLQGLWKELIQFPHLGAFMSYEIVCDLRYTHLLQNATDTMTWANPGPGALRGLLRLEGGTIPMNSRNGPKRAVSVRDPLKKMVKLLHWVNERLPSHMPRFDLRCVEHSACEFDKYLRGLEMMLYGTPGKMKRVYNGKG